LKGAIVSRPAGGRAGSGEFGRAREVVAPPLEDVGEVGREVGEGAAEEDEEAKDDRVCGRVAFERWVRSARCEREEGEVGDARTKMTSHCERARGKSGLGHGEEQERRERERERTCSNMEPTVRLEYQMRQASKVPILRRGFDWMRVRPVGSMSWAPGGTCE